MITKEIKQQLYEIDPAIQIDEGQSDFKIYVYDDNFMYNIVETYIDKSEIKCIIRLLRYVKGSKQS